MKALTLLLTTVFLAGCTQTHHEADSRRYVHIVILWLKNPGNVADRQKLIDTSRSFVGKVPGLVRVSAGPVLPSTRPVVDSSYDVGLVMIFDSEESLRKYPSYPVHQRALKEVIGPLVDHYRVYDFPDTKAAEGRLPD